MGLKHFVPVKTWSCWILNQVIGPSKLVRSAQISRSSQLQYFTSPSNLRTFNWRCWGLKVWTLPQSTHIPGNNGPLQLFGVGSGFRKYISVLRAASWYYFLGVRPRHLKYPFKRSRFEWANECLKSHSSVQEAPADPGWHTTLINVSCLKVAQTVHGSVRSEYSSAVYNGTRWPQYKHWNRRLSLSHPPLPKWLQGYLGIWSANLCYPPRKNYFDQGCKKPLERWYGNHQIDRHGSWFCQSSAQILLWAGLALLIFQVPAPRRETQFGLAKFDSLPS